MYTLRPRVSSLPACLLRCCSIVLCSRRTTTQEHRSCLSVIICLARLDYIVALRLTWSLSSKINFPLLQSAVHRQIRAQAMEANTRRPTTQAQSKLLCVLQEQSESEGDTEDDEEDMGHDELLELSSTRQVEWKALRFLCFRLDMLSCHTISWQILVVTAQQRWSAATSKT